MLEFKKHQTIDGSLKIVKRSKFMTLRNRSIIMLIMDKDFKIILLLVVGMCAILLPSSCTQLFVYITP